MRSQSMDMSKADAAIAGITKFYTPQLVATTLKKADDCDSAWKALSDLKNSDGAHYEWSKLLVEDPLQKKDPWDEGRFRGIVAKGRNLLTIKS